MSDEEWYDELRARYKHVLSLKSSWERDNYMRQKYTNPESKFFNPDAWSRLIGKSNVVYTYIDGQKVKVLLDTGAQISFMSEEYAKKRGFKIHPIEKLVNFTGANGLAIEYSGYVEVNLQLPQQKFNEDILILVVPHIEYHNFVPVTLGTHTLETIDQHFVSNNLIKELDTEWRLVHQAILYRQSLAKDEILGQVKTTKSIKVPPFSTINISGSVRLPKGGYSLHVVVEDSDSSNLPDGINLAGEQYTNICLGSSRVGVLLENQTEDTITIKPKTIICQLVLGNMVPKLVAPSYDNVEIDPHLYDDDIPETLNDEQPPMDYTEFKRTADQMSSSVQGSGLKSAEKPTMSCTATTEDAHTSSTKDDGSWLLEQIDLSGAQSYGEDFYQKTQELFKKYHTTFSKDDLDLGRATSVKHYIKLTDSVPFKERYRRIPPQLYDEVKQHLQEMLRLGAIRKSCSPWASAIVLVRKKNGKLRFCIDLRKLNQRTLKDSYALPRIEQTLESLADSQIYSTLDLTSGYWQVEMAEECKPYTAFTCGPLGFYECETMPFGATNAPATFQRLMEDCLGDLNMNWCIVYLDDVIVYSKTPEEHLERLEAVFQKLSNAGLKLKPSKCSFFKNEITYLGHLITADGIATDPKKIEAVLKWPQPETVSDVRSFLGFVGYYRRFIKGFSSLSRPLYNLTKGSESKSKRVAKHTYVSWGEKEQEAFLAMKEACTTVPVLGYPDYSLPFILHTDSSTDGLGAVLYQQQGPNKKDDMRVIAYASRSLSPSEANYAPHKLEFLALKWAITDKFKEYLYGENKFEVYTDNNPLTYILTSAKLDACGQRWVAALANFNFTLHYKPGSTNTIADALSRIIWPDILTETETEEYRDMPANLVQTICCGVICDSLIDNTAHGLSVLPLESHIPTQRGWNKDDWIRLQQQDPDIQTILELMQTRKFGKRHAKRTDSKPLKHYLRMKSQLKVIDGILYRRTFSGNDIERLTTYQIVLPKHLFKTVMKGCHDQAGHQGRDRTISLVRERFYWDTLYKDTTDYVANCPRCLRRKAKPNKAPLQPFFASQPMEIIHLDHLTLEPCKGQYESVLVVTDHFTRYAQAYEVKNQTAQTTAKTLWREFLRHYGFPQKILTDQGPGFESDLFAELLSITNTEKLRTTSYHPQTNGQCERFNSTLMNMLGTMSESQKKDWKSHLLTMCHAYNSTQHAVTGYSPHYLMFGRHPRIPLDYQMGIDRDNLSNPLRSKFVSKLNERLKFAYEKAELLAQQEAQRQKRLYDKRSRNLVLSPGDLVLVRIVKWTARHKIQDKWEEEEYVVVSQPDPEIPVYKVKPLDGGKVRTLHRNLLLPLGLQLKSFSNEDSLDDSFGEMRELEHSNPEVGIISDDSVVDPSVEHSLDPADEDVNADEETSSINSETSETSSISDNYQEFREFWELIDTDNPQNKEVPLTKDNSLEDGSEASLVDNEHGPKIPNDLVEEPLSQEIDRGDEDMPLAPKDGGKSTVKPDTSPILKTYPKRTTKNKPPKRYGWSLSPFKAIWI